MSEIKETNVTLETNLTFWELKNHLHLIKWPSKNWCYVEGNSLFVGFQRVDNDGRVRKRVAVFNTMKVTVYFNSKKMPFSPFMSVTNIQEIIELLNVIENWELQNEK